MNIKLIILEEYNKIKNNSITLYHYDRIDKLTELDPQKVNPNSYSKDEYQTWNRKRVFYYTDPTQINSDTGVSNQHLYITEIETNKLYDLNKDPKKYFENAEQYRVDYTQRIIDNKIKGSIYQLAIPNNIDSETILNKIKKIRLNGMLFLKNIKLTNNDENYKYYEIEQTNTTNTLNQTGINKISNLGEGVILTFIKEKETTTLPNVYELTYKQAKEEGYEGFIYNHVSGTDSNRTVILWVNKKVKQEY